VRNKMWEAAHLTVLETRRNRAVHAILLIHLIVLGVALLLASVTMGETVNIVVDLGLMSLSVLGSLVALVVTVQTMRQDIEQRTIHVLLPRVGSRTLYVLSRFLGIALVLGAAIVLMSVMLGIFVVPLGWIKWVELLQACCSTLLEVWIAIAVALLFSNASSMFLAIFLTLAVLLAGRFSLVIKQFGESVGGITEHLTDAAYYLLPNFQVINLRNRIVDFPALPPGEFARILSYGITEVALLLCVACLFFMRKDLHGDG